MFGGAYETDLHNPDFVKFAESFGAVGLRANDPLELETLIPQAMESQGPVVIDVPFGDMGLVSYVWSCSPRTYSGHP